MMSAELASWQSNNKYRKEEDIVYGVYQGCGFTVSEEDGGKLFIFMLSARDDRAFDDFENALASAGGIIADGQVGDVESYLAVFFDESRRQLPSTAMDQIINFTATEARQCGFRVPNICVKCGARATKRSFVDNMVQPLCADCSARNKQNRRAAAASSATTAPVVPPAAPIISPDTQPYRQPQQNDYYNDNQYANNSPITQDDEYSQQYAPIVPDSSKYDDSYDEYAGMTSQYSQHDGGYNDNYNDNNDNYNGNYSNADNSQYSGSSAISFSGNDEDDYNSIMGNDEDYQSSPTEIGGKMGMGILGALAGSIVGVIPYLIVTLAASFPMGALCFPAGMLAVVFYTMFGGRKLKNLGMALCISCGSIISIITVFFAMIFSYMNETTNFSGAVSYLFSDQTVVFCLNVLFAVLSVIFGAFLMIGVMAKYAMVDMVLDKIEKSHGDSNNNFDFN